MRRMKAVCLLALALIFHTVCAAAQYDAQMADAWLGRFAQEISALEPKNDVLATADPARAGEYLTEYDFGTVTAKTPAGMTAGDILRIEISAPGVTDCRGLTVGQSLEDVIAGREIGASETMLYVLSTQESGYGWCWAYVGDTGVYGVEYITYGGDALAMKEYTLTYVIKDGLISAIRMQIAEATQALAEEGLRTAEEIAGRQLGEKLAFENSQPAFDETDMAVSYRRIIGEPVEELVALVGEPQEIQSLPDGGGRMLVYAFCAAELAFDEMTGVERVRSFSCVVPGVAGPRGLEVGMELANAAALFRCDGSVYSTGGELYLAGEAQGVAPYGELVRDAAGVYALKYTCVMQTGEIGVLNVGAKDGVVTHWNISIESTEAAYGG